MVLFDKDMADGPIGEVDLKDEEGYVIGKAGLEKVGSTVMVSVDAKHLPEAVTEGFRLGSYSIYNSGQEPEIHPFDMPGVDETMFRPEARINMVKRSSTFDA